MVSAASPCPLSWAACTRTEAWPCGKGTVCFWAPFLACIRWAKNSFLRAASAIDFLPFRSVRKGVNFQSILPVPALAASSLSLPVLRPSLVRLEELWRRLEL